MKPLGVLHSDGSERYMTMESSLPNALTVTSEDSLNAKSSN